MFFYLMHCLNAIPSTLEILIFPPSLTAKSFVLDHNAYSSRDHRQVALYLKYPVGLMSLPLQLKQLQIVNQFNFFFILPVYRQCRCVKVR